jgi:hypothetical protein
MGLAACGGSDGRAEGSPQKPVTRPEDVIAPLAEVLSKLPALVELGNTVKTQAAAGDYGGASGTLESLENLWFEVEGAVGDSDRNAYEAIETAQGLLRDGVQTRKADRVAKGAADQATSIQQFLARSR